MVIETQMNPGIEMFSGQLRPDRMEESGVTHCRDCSVPRPDECSEAKSKRLHSWKALETAGTGRSLTEHQMRQFSMAISVTVDSKKTLAAL